MIILSDLSRVVIFPKDKNYLGSLNELHKELRRSVGENYNAWEYFELNNELLSFYKELKSKYSIVLFTTDIIQDHHDIKVELEKVFYPIFSAKVLGVSKKDPEAYEKISSLLGSDPSELLFIDDQEVNLEAAQRATCKMIKYESVPILISQISAVLGQQKKS